MQAKEFGDRDKTEQHSATYYDHQDRGAEKLPRIVGRTFCRKSLAAHNDDVVITLAQEANALVPPTSCFLDSPFSI